MNQSSPGIALLVDIENIKISLSLESAIIKMFPPVKIIKIAVGNWQLLKGIDRQLLDRGYHLFHVPTGVDNADRELINLGWMLKDVSELIIVSSDKIFIRFAYQLKFGIKATSIVYYSQPQAAFVITKTQIVSVEEKPESFVEPRVGDNPQTTVDNKDKKATKSTNIGNQTNSFTSQPQFVQALKQLVAKNKSINSPATLGSEFRKKFGIKASSVITKCQIPVSFTKFILDNEILTVDNENFAPASPKDELIINVRKLIQARPPLAQEPGQLSNEFKKLYGSSISEQMKQIGIPGKLSKFIAEIQPDRNCDQN
jgi:hypothetical protein